MCAHLTWEKNRNAAKITYVIDCGEISNYILYCTLMFLLSVGVYTCTLREEVIHCQW